MNKKMKMMVGTALVLGVLSIAFFATPILAYVNGIGNGDLLQRQDQDRLRTQNRDLLQMQDPDKDRLRTEDCDCTCNCTQTQCRSRQRTNECVTNRICNCTMNSEHYRNQNGEITRSLRP